MPTGMMMTQKTPPELVFFLFVVIIIVILLFIQRARGSFPFSQPVDYKIRRLRALEALDTAIGRSTELGRPIHFSLGAGRFTPDTFAGFAMLGYVARKCAEYDCPLIVTNMQVTVHMATTEIVQSAYKEAGYPDRLRPNSVRFISKDEFPYVAGALSVIRDEQVASNVVLGTCGPASLILVEGAHVAGAFQITGTDDEDQLPFYFVTSEEVLLGEEIYGAGAALGADPIVRGSFRGQDWLRLSIILIILILTAVVTMVALGVSWQPLNELSAWLASYHA